MLVSIIYKSTIPLNESTKPKKKEKENKDMLKSLLDVEKENLIQLINSKVNSESFKTYYFKMLKEKGSLETYSIFKNKEIHSSAFYNKELDVKVNFPDSNLFQPYFYKDLKEYYDLSFEGLCSHYLKAYKRESYLKTFKNVAFKKEIVEVRFRNQGNEGKIYNHSGIYNNASFCNLLSRSNNDIGNYNIESKVSNFNNYFPNDSIINSNNKFKEAIYNKSMQFKSSINQRDTSNNLAFKSTFFNNNYNNMNSNYDNSLLQSNQSLKNISVNNNYINSNNHKSLMFPINFENSNNSSLKYCIAPNYNISVSNFNEELQDNCGLSNFPISNISQNKFNVFNKLSAKSQTNSALNNYKTAAKGNNNKNSSFKFSQIAHTSHAYDDTTAHHLYSDSNNNGKVNNNLHISENQRNYQKHNNISNFYKEEKDEGYNLKHKDSNVLITNKIHINNYNNYISCKNANCNKTTNNTDDLINISLISNNKTNTNTGCINKSNNEDMNIDKENNPIPTITNFKCYENNPFVFSIFNTVKNKRPDIEDKNNHNDNNNDEDDGEDYYIKSSPNDNRERINQNLSDFQDNNFNKYTNNANCEDNLKLLEKNIISNLKKTMSKEGTSRIGSNLFRKRQADKEIKLSEFDINC